MHLHELTAALEERHVQSCIITIGFPYPFVITRVVTVTGGATFADCAIMDTPLSP